MTLIDETEFKGIYLKKLLDKMRELSQKYTHFTMSQRVEVVKNLR